MLNTSALLAAAKGHIFTGPVGIESPSLEDIMSFSPAQGIKSMDSIGHTSRGDLPEFGFDGGDTEVKGTWQEEAVEEKLKEAIVDFVKFKPHQIDEAVLRFYYGAENHSKDVGKFGVASSSGVAQEASLLLIIMDGMRRAGFFAAKTSIRRSDPIKMEIDNFAEMTLKATFLKVEGRDLFEWISPVFNKPQTPTPAPAPAHP